MIASQEYTRIYNEIRLLMQAGLYEAANHAIPELYDFAMTNRQIMAASAIEDFLIQKLDEDPGDFDEEIDESEFPENADDYEADEDEEFEDEWDDYEDDLPW